jgi:ribose 1,5-bisphosphokinase PhnN
LNCQKNARKINIDVGICMLGERKERRGREKQRQIDKDIDK